VQVYCDDIVIFSKTRQEHLAHVRMVLEKLLEELLVVHHKTNGPRDAAAPQVLCQGVQVPIRALLRGLSRPRHLGTWRRCRPPQGRRSGGVGYAPGLANVYRKFVPRFSALAAPLTALCSPRA
jgi:hypothetical protein